MSDCLRAALHYARVFGWMLFPARIEGGKKFSWLKKDKSPSGLNWGMTKDLDQIQEIFSDKRWATKCGVGLPTGADNDIFVIEVDTPKGHGVDGEASFARLEATHGKLPKTLMAKSPSGSIHRFFRHPGIRIKSTDSIRGYAGVDCKGDGGMVVIPPTPRKDGIYEWVNDEEIADAPAWLIELVKDEERSIGSNGFDPDDPFHKIADEARPPPSLLELQLLLSVIPNESLSWDEWNRVGMAIFSVLPGDDGLDLFDEWSQKSEKYNERKTKAKWRLFRSSPPTQISVGTLYYLADEADPGWRDQKEDEEVNQEEAKPKASAEIVYLTLPQLAATPLEEVEWIVPDLIMRHAVNGMFGDGGAGKDWLMLQLAIAMAVEHPWLGIDVVPGKVLYFNVEDQVRHIRWRQARVAKHYNADCSDPAHEMRIVPMVGKDTLWATFDQRKGRVRPTTVFESARKMVGEFKPDLVIVGNRVNIFAVGQNDDAQARQCIELLNSLVMDFGATVIMPGHVSKSGMADESGTSGSVQWSNGVRHRLLLRPIKKETDEDPLNEDERRKRVLEVKKTNWTATGYKLGLHWHKEKGLFVGDEEGITVVRKPFDPKDREAEIDSDFMELFKEAMEIRHKLSPSPTARNNIAKVLSGMSSGSKYDTRKGHQLLYAAFERARKRQLVMVKQYGSPSNETYMVVYPPAGDNVIRGKFEKKD